MPNIDAGGTSEWVCWIKDTSSFSKSTECDFRITASVKGQEKNQDITVKIHGNDVWGFSNDSSYFVPLGGTGHEISDNLKKQLISSVSKSELDKIQKEIWGNTPWGGSCFGMSASTALFLNGRLTPSYWDTAATSVGMIKNDAKSLVNYYQALRATRAIMDIEELYTAPIVGVTDRQSISIIRENRWNSNSNDVIVLGFSWAKSKEWGILRERGAHSIVLYGNIESCNVTIENVTYRSRIRTYDPTNNFGDTYFYFDDNGHFAIPNWTNNKVYTKITSIISGSFLGELLDKYNPEKHAVKPMMLNEEPSQYIQLTSCASDMLTVITTDGVDAIDGMLSDGVLGLQPYYSYGATSNEEDSYNLKVFLPRTYEAYTITNSDDNRNMDLSMLYYDSYAVATCANGNSISFAADNSISMNMNNSDYMLSQVFDDGSRSIPWYKLAFTGDNANNVSMKRLGDDTIFISDNMQNVVVTAESNIGSVVLQFSTVMEKVLIRADDNELIICVDADGDGEYETPIASTAEQFTVVVTAGEGGTVSGGDTYSEGSEVTLTATPNTNYLFDGWYENDEKISSAGATYTFTATINRTLEARFAPTVPTMKYSVSVTTPTIVETLAAYLNITVTGDTKGNSLTAYLKVGEEMRHPTPIVDGTGRMFIAAAPAAGEYELVVIAEDSSAEGSCLIEVTTYDTDIWMMNITANKAGYMVLVFNETIAAKDGKFDKEVSLNGKAISCELGSDGRSLITSVKEATLPTGGNTFTVTGVKYPRLFPSYSFTFTAEITK